MHCRVDGTNTLYSFCNRIHTNKRKDFLVAVVNESPVLVHLYGVSDYTVDNMSSILISESRANKESVRGKHLKLFTDI